MTEKEFNSKMRRRFNQIVKRDVKNMQRADKPELSGDYWKEYEEIKNALLFFLGEDFRCLNSKQIIKLLALCLRYRPTNKLHTLLEYFRSLNDRTEKGN